MKKTWSLFSLSCSWDTCGEETLGSQAGKLDTYEDGSSCHGSGMRNIKEVNKWRKSLFTDWRPNTVNAVIHRHFLYSFQVVFILKSHLIFWSNCQLFPNTVNYAKHLRKSIQLKNNRVGGANYVVSKFTVTSLGGMILL